VSPLLSALIALQDLDSAAEAARRRLAEMPAAEQAIRRALETSQSAIAAIQERMRENQESRRALERDVAGVDVRLRRFDDHRAAVKTNQEYTALLHEIATAKAEKDAVEERLLLLMEAADALAAEQKAAEAAHAEEEQRASIARKALDEDRRSSEAELARIAGERAGVAREIDARTLGLYEQLIKGRRGVAVARMSGEICAACHVRLRPHVTQQIRRNDAVVQCDSCQRILYWIAPAS
jgi:predicted  nucleic acid-binding Zn-ribbon protein